MEILYILIPSVAIPLAIALLFFFICVCRNNQKSSRPPAPRQPKPVRGQNVEMSMLTTAYKPKVEGSRDLLQEIYQLAASSDASTPNDLPPAFLLSLWLLCPPPHLLLSICLFVIVSHPPFLHLCTSFSSFIASRLSPRSFCNINHPTRQRKTFSQLCPLCILC